MTTTPTRKRLTVDEMERVTSAARDISWTAAVVETFACFGVDLADPNVETVRPSDYAIPVDQWGKIAEACSAPRAGGNDIARVNHLFDWMNYGPSGYEPDEVTS